MQKWHHYHKLLHNNNLIYHSVLKQTLLLSTLSLISRNNIYLVLKNKKQATSSSLSLPQRYHSKQTPFYLSVYIKYACNNLNTAVRDSLRLINVLFTHLSLWVGHLQCDTPLSVNMKTHNWLCVWICIYTHLQQRGWNERGWGISPIKRCLVSRPEGWEQISQLLGAAVHLITHTAPPRWPPQPRAIAGTPNTRALKTMRSCTTSFQRQSHLTLLIICLGEWRQREYHLSSNCTNSGWNTELIRRTQTLLMIKYNINRVRKSRGQWKNSFLYTNVP